MIEVFPKKVSEEKIQANLQKLIAAFLSVAEDFVKENEEQTQTVQITETEEISICP